MSSSASLDLSCSALVLSLLGALACDSGRSEASTLPEASKVALTQPAPPPAAAPAEVATSAQQSYRESEFSVVLEGPQSGKVGESLTLKVKLEAGTGFKVNHEYPIRFVVHKVAGIAAEKETVPKEDATYEGHGATLPVKIKLETAGPHEVRGRFHFSVCKEGDASVCLLEKRELKIALSAS